MFGETFTGYSFCRGIFATPETTDGLGTSTQTVPEGNATNTNFKRTNNTQSLAGANRAVIRTMDFLIA